MLSTLSGQALVDYFPKWCGTGHETGANLAHVRFLLATEKLQIGEKNNIRGFASAPPNGMRSAGVSGALELGRWY